MTKSFVTIADLSKEKIMSLLEAAARFEENPNRKTLDGKVIATLFFEPSTRTRLSFETAVNRLGGRVIGFSDAATSSSSKGESLKDTIMMVSNYADIILKVPHATLARYHLYPSSMPVTVPTSIPHKRCSTSILSIRHRAHWKTSISILWATSSMAAQYTLC